MENLDEVLNWRRLDGNVTTSGQPTEAQLSKIRDLGVSDIINLGPHSSKGSLEDEAASVTALGMNYAYIPVDFKDPTEEDFSRFCETIDGMKDRKIHVHCIFNARVSAFMYRYAKSSADGSEHEAFAIMDSIWKPGGVWARFIGNSGSNEEKHRYWGLDYQ